MRRCCNIIVPVLIQISMSFAKMVIELSRGILRLAEVMTSSKNLTDLRQKMDVL